MTFEECKASQVCILFVYLINYFVTNLGGHETLKSNGVGLFHSTYSGTSPLLTPFGQLKMSRLVNST